MINPQWLELPMSRTIFYGPKDVRAIEVRLYSERRAWANGVDPYQTTQNSAFDQGLHYLPLTQQFYKHSQAVKWTYWREV